MELFEKRPRGFEVQQSGFIDTIRFVDHSGTIKIAFPLGREGESLVICRALAE